MFIPCAARKLSTADLISLGIIVALVGCGGGASTTTTSTGGGGNPAAVSITTQPASATVQEQKTTQFQVVATGGGTLTYQWQKNNTAIAGATQATYSYGPAQLADSGDSFTVVVSNGSSTATSSAAVLSVTPAPMTVSATTSTMVAPFGTFTLTGTRTTPTASTGVDAVKEQYALEYTFTGGAVVDVPVNLQSDGSVLGVAPPGTISGGQLQPGNVLVRVRRILQTSPSAKATTDYSNTLTLTITAAPTLPTAPGYATELLIVIGKYLIADAVTHSNGFMDTTTAQTLSSFDFDTQAANVVASLDAPTLAMVDSLSASTILTAFNYDIVSGTFTAAAGRLSGRRLDALGPRAAAEDTVDGVGSNIVATAWQSLGTDIRIYGPMLEKPIQVVGVAVAILGAATQNYPLLLAGGGAAALASYVANGTTIVASFIVDMAASLADPSSSSTPESRFEAILPSFNYAATSGLSSTIETVADPLNGEVDEWMKEHMPAQAYDAYQTAAPFIYAFADSISEKIDSFANSVATSDPSTPPSDKATFDADLEATSATPVEDAIDTSALNQPAAPSSGGADSALEAELDADINELDSLTNTLAMVSALPGNQSASALESFSTCSSGFIEDFGNLANEMIAAGTSVTEQQVAAWVTEATTDTQGIVGCGAALGTSLSQASPNASNTQTGTSGTDQVTVTAANCDSAGAGCWITEETKHADGTSSSETGYVACQKSGFCPLYLH